MKFFTVEILGSPWIRLVEFRVEFTANDCVWGEGFCVDRILNTIELQLKRAEEPSAASASSSIRISFLLCAVCCTIDTPFRLYASKEKTEVRSSKKEAVAGEL